MEACSNLGLNSLLKNAIGCPFCESIAPIPILDASVSIVNGRVKSSKIRTGAEVDASFSVQKAYLASLVHLKGSFVVVLIKGATIKAYR